MCDFIRALIRDVLPNGTLIVEPEFVRVFRVERYREFAGGYAVDAYSLPEPLRSYIIARYLRPMLAEMERVERRARRAARARVVRRRQGISR